MQAIALRNPAIASGFQLISLIRNPPADQRTEVSARRSADRFKLKRRAGCKEFPAVLHRRETCLSGRAVGSDRLEHQRSVVAAEAERVVHGRLDLGFSRCVWNVIKIAFGISVI